MSEAIDLFAEHDSAPPVSLATAPGSRTLSDVASAAQELVNIDRAVERATALLDRLDRRRRRLSEEVLPSMLDAANTDTFGLPQAGVDVVVKNHYRAAIPVSWEEEQRRIAFDHLVAMDAGHLIRAQVTVSFDQAELPHAKRLVAAIMEWLKAKQLTPTVDVGLQVHHGSLTSWMRKELEKPAEDHRPGSNKTKLNIALIGGFVTRVCSIVPRKEKKSRERRGKK